MKRQVIYYILCFFAGSLAIGAIIMCWKGYFDFSINIIDFLMLIVTIVLSIAIIYLSKAIEKEDVVRDILVADINELCTIYFQNTQVLINLQNKQIDIATARAEIMLQFNKIDLIIDCIKEEFSQSFPKFMIDENINLVEITTPYYKWLTGESSLFEKDITIDQKFLKEHETNMRKTTTALKLIVHKLVKRV